MKKLLLGTALSCVLAAPVFAPAHAGDPVLDAARAIGGAQVDTSAASAVQSEAEKAVEEAVKDAVAEQVQEQVPEAVQAEVEEQIKDAVEAEVKEQFNAQVEAAVEDAVDEVVPKPDPVIEIKAPDEALVTDDAPLQVRASNAAELSVEAPAVVDVEEDVVVDPPAAPVIKGEAWSYSGANAAPYWGSLDAGYALCSNGAQQSPINIAQFLQEDLPDIQAAYQPSPLTVVNNGHTIQVDYEAGSSMSVDGVQYALLQTHFHTPSEHYLDGAPYPMELHLVHQAADGTLAVIGVMMKVGEHNPVIEGVWQNAPIKSGETKSLTDVKINPVELLPASKEYYKYQGSLTTPPCTEGVQWHVMKDPIELSEKQLKAFQALYPVNARPVQPLGDRVVTGD